MTLFDAHLDLAYLAECGRDMTCADLSACAGPHPPAAVTFPSLRAGGVSACLGTIFTQAVPDPSAPDAATGSYTYPLGDSQAAHAAGVRQLDRYHAWERAGLISLMPRRASPSGPGAPLTVGILIECADPIRTPEELPFWVDRGVVAIGLAWVHGGRYAAGNGADPSDAGAGLTDLGRALVRAMDALGVVHDLSHLSQRATDELLALTDAPVIASHSNCRALLDRDAYPHARQRHLDDATIREIARRGGVIGINLLSGFLDASLRAEERAPLDRVARHMEHILALTGDHRVIGLGTDMDGGFAADRLPVSIDGPEGLGGIPALLASRGLGEEVVSGVMWGNWARFWGVSEAS